MCGIFGVYDRGGGRPAEAWSRAMADRLRHRGPDEEGIVSKDGVLLGNRRLSILDLAGGHQPFVSDDGTISVVQNGEIFNYVELTAEDRLPCRTHSDTEVLLRLYERHGTAFLPRLNGMFAFAVHDARRRRLWIARDRVGVKPLYLHDNGRQLFFASEIKALLAAGVPAQLDEEALHHYLTFNYVPPPLTIFRGIRHLRPGHALTVDPTGVREEPWWDLSAVRPETRSDDEWMRAFLDTLSDAVRLRLRSDVPFGAFLSGGTDSSTIVAMMAGHLKAPVKTFTIGFDDPKYDESPFAEQVARTYGTEHVLEKVESNLASLWPLAVYSCDQPHGDASFMPTYRVSQLAARKVKVVLTGDGGDELFAGYEKYADFFAGPAPADEEAFERAYFDSISLLDAAGKRDLYSPELRGRLADSDSFAIAAPLFRAFRHQDRINRALALDTLLLLPGNNLVKPDRMGMAVSIEARTPFLDYRMIDLAFRMPGALKLAGKDTKHLYKRAIEPMLGRELVHRKKQMFTVPVGEWFKGPLAPFMEAVLLSPRTSARGHFRRERVAAVLQEHRTGRANHTRLIRALIALELWHRIFVDRLWDRAPSFTELGLPEPRLPVDRPRGT
jgi:asparagine synthase (glutamine-hydrolysing)